MNKIIEVTLLLMILFLSLFGMSILFIVDDSIIDFSALILLLSLYVLTIIVTRQTQ